MVQRELAGAQRGVHRRRVVDLADDRLARAVHAAGDDTGAMRSLAASVAPGQELHAAVLRRRVGQREPGGHVHVGAQAEIGGVLVPGGDRRALGLLDEPRRRVHQDVRADQVLDGVQDRGMANERVHPREEDVGAGSVARVRPLGREWPADRLLECRELPPEVRRLPRCERGVGREKPVSLVALDLSRR